MKVIALYVLRLPEDKETKDDSKVEILCEADDADNEVGYIKRSAFRDFMKFSTRTIALRTDEGGMQMVEDAGYKMHVLRPVDGKRIVGAAVTDPEYPDRVAQGLLSKLTKDFLEEVPEENFGNRAKITFPAIHSMLRKYQDPKEADPIMKVQKDLDETKIILHKTIESVLDRGEKLDNLVDRSNALSSQTKMFYKTAKKQNSCCVVM
ncbi:snare-like protein [Schizopora paradoxa]|uniref:Synaptobrevin homolog YKT6 n=1 Tax=Schizopora paradoxa TaxID=27342 RepID=A0A0H2RSA0_9AGAM|nr:snare-like protein [Schizopora paradoxa]